MRFEFYRILRHWKVRVAEYETELKELREILRLLASDVEPRPEKEIAILDAQGTMKFGDSRHLRAMKELVEKREEQLKESREIARRLEGEEAIDETSPFYSLTYINELREECAEKRKVLSELELKHAAAIKREEMGECDPEDLDDPTDFWKSEIENLLCELGMIESRLEPEEEKALEIDPLWLAERELERDAEMELEKKLRAKLEMREREEWENQESKEVTAQHHEALRKNYLIEIGSLNEDGEENEEEYDEEEEMSRELEWEEDINERTGSPWSDTAWDK